MKRESTMKAKLLSAAVLASGIAGWAACGTALADSKDGVFPSAEQVGGQVYVDPIKVGTKFPTDIELYDSSGSKANLGKLLSGKRTVIAFFISAAPVSVAELRKLQDFVSKSAPGVQILNLNADTVGTALEGGAGKAISATVKTLEVIKRENGISTPLFVAPNDALSPTGLSNRIGFRGLPTIFVLNTQGVVEKIFVGPQRWKQGDIS